MYNSHLPIYPIFEFEFGFGFLNLTHVPCCDLSTTLIWTSTINNTLCKSSTHIIIQETRYFIFIEKTSFLFTFLLICIGIMVNHFITHLPDKLVIIFTQNVVFYELLMATVSLFFSYVFCPVGCVIIQICLSESVTYYAEVPSAR